MNNILSRSCLACDKILKGRIDKKFCDDYCRNHYNNHQRADTTNYARNIISMLRRNRKILDGLLGSAETIKVSREQLLLEGFQFKYHTHTFETRKGGLYTYCFEMGFLSLDYDLFLIVRRLP